MKLLRTLIISSWFILLAGLAQPVFAGTNLTVDCFTLGADCSVTPPATPLFNETNLIPGDNLYQIVTAHNGSAQDGTFAIEAFDLEDDGVIALLSNVMVMEVREGSVTGPIVLGPVTLKDLINPDPHYLLLSGVNAGATKKYYFVAKLHPSAGNEYKQLTSIFDLRLGFALLPVASPSPSGSGGGASPSPSGSTTIPSPTICTATPPNSAPSVIITNVGSNTVSLSWTAVSPVTHYGLVFTRTSDGAQYGSTNIGNVTSYTVTNLSGGANYTFQVFGVNDCAPGPLSNNAATGIVPGPFIAGRPTGPGGAVLGVTTESPTPAASPAAGGEVKGTETEAACVQWKLYIPWILLVMQFFLVLASEYYFKKDRKWTKHYVAAGVTLASIFIFYLIRECQCYGEGQAFLAWLCKWYWLVALLLSAFVKAASYAFIEEIQDQEEQPSLKS